MIAPLDRHTVISEKGFYKTIVLDGEAEEIIINFDQKWIPRASEYMGQFKVGQIVGLRSWLQHQLYVSAAMVSRVRDFQDHKNRPPHSQIEMAGMPLRWFSDHHFYP